MIDCDIAVRIHRVCVLAMLLLSCSRERPASVPALPEIQTSGFQPSVREAVESAVREAKSKPTDADAAARLGMVLHAHGQFAAAVVCYRRAGGLDASQPMYPYLEGAALASAGTPVDAVAPLTRATSLDRSSIPIRLRLADALFESGEKNGAASQYRMVLRQDASIAEAHYGLGRTLKGEAAIAELRRALELFPAYGAAQFALAGVYRSQGQTAEAEELLRSYEQNRTKTPPVDDPMLGAVYALSTSGTGLLQRAQALEREGRLREAAEACERAAQENPSAADPWVNLISLYGRLGEGSKAEAAYKSAVSVAPNRADAYYNFGVFCLMSSRLDEARKAFSRATALDEGNAEAWNNLAAVVERSGNLDEAANDYRRAIALRPENRASHFGLGRILANQQRYAEAIDELEKTLHPDDAQTAGYLYALGAVHERAGHRQKALDLLTRARSKASGVGQAGLVSSIDRDLQTLGASR